jgi:hypothetical protein
MRIGVSLASDYGLDDAREGARKMIDRAAAARDVYLDILFVSDHHATGPGNYYQNVPMLGRLLAEWGNRPADALFQVPLWHPVLLAEQIGTLAAIYERRFILQCAVGQDGDGQMDALGGEPLAPAVAFRGEPAVHAPPVGRGNGDPSGALDVRQRLHRPGAAGAGGGLDRREPERPNRPRRAPV